MYFYTIAEERLYDQMPRRHKSPTKRRLSQGASKEAAKVRYPSKQAALAAIREHEKYNLDTPLRPYQSPNDGGWYLTRNSERI
jgi:hypothetical protein